MKASPCAAACAATAAASGASHARGPGARPASWARISGQAGSRSVRVKSQMRFSGNPLCRCSMPADLRVGGSDSNPDLLPDLIQRPRRSPVPPETVPPSAPRPSACTMAGMSSGRARMRAARPRIRRGHSQGDGYEDGGDRGPSVRPCCACGGRWLHGQARRFANSACRIQVGRRSGKRPRQCGDVAAPAGLLTCAPGSLSESLVKATLGWQLQDGRR